jgi:hypothetical protein
MKDKMAGKKGKTVLHQGDERLNSLKGRGNCPSSGKNERRMQENGP